MDLYFIDHEAPEREYFENSFPEHRLHFLGNIDDVPADAEVISIFIQSKITSEFLSAHPALQLVATRSTTGDHIDLAACRRAGVTVSSVPSYGKYTVAEHTFALMLALARRLRQAFEAHRKPSFSYEGLRGMRLRGKTLGVVGAGKIGLRVLHLAQAFGMKCLACDICPRPEMASRLGFTYVEFPELLARSDIISLHCSLTPASYHLMNAGAFARCRRGVFVLNTARGALIDPKALLQALDSGVVAGAGLDVLEDERVFRHDITKIVSNQIVHRLHNPFAEREPRAHEPERIRELMTLIHNEELLSRPNVVFTPHIAFNSAEALECINRTTVSNIEAFLRGEPANILTAATPPEPSSETGRGKPCVS